MSDPHLSTPSGKRRARALGIPLSGTPGKWNSITDVPGVEVGYVTRIEGDSVRTGVSAIHPRGRSGPGDPCAAGTFSFNGNGEMTGVSWIAESGTMSGPVCITNTHAVGVAHAGIVAWVHEHHPDLTDVWLLPVAAETFDGYLNDINGHHVDEAHVITALATAESGPIEEGSVGGGTGMNCYAFKGGNGTASRLVEHRGVTHTVGVFVQANFGRRNELTIAGRHIGPDLSADDPVGIHFAGEGSIIAVVVTDAPLLPDQCRALARRVTIGIGRTGTHGSHSSGDIFLAVSTANPDGFADAKHADGSRDPYCSIDFVPWGAINPFFDAVVQATEEAVLNALVANEVMVGRNGHRSPALPHDFVRELFAQS
jgi:D-aminopeptidase